MFSDTYRGRKVLVTGHTGFKGSWLVTWLLELGARVAGYALAPHTDPSNFDVLDLSHAIDHHIGDVRDREGLAAAIRAYEPEIVFHLAAQALVRTSYADAPGTFETNAIGTLNVLETVRRAPSVRAVVVVTSDKAYANQEWVWGYRETDRLGGEDPYSASKACAELISASYIASFYRPREGAAAVATARAGNVIGGGDWAENRIVPDCIRAWHDNKPVVIRNPASTRPWQHVLEPLSGYLHLGSYLLARNPAVMWESYNFGPDATVNQTVQALIEWLAEGWKGSSWESSEPASPGQHEARLLKLCCDKALNDLDWRPVLRLEETVAFTRDWYTRHRDHGAEGMRDFTVDQIRRYTAKATERGLPWTR